jgi:hypothetical protein
MRILRFLEKSKNRKGDNLPLQIKSISNIEKFIDEKIEASRANSVQGTYFKEENGRAS